MKLGRIKLTEEAYRRIIILIAVFLLLLLGLCNFYKKDKESRDVFMNSAVIENSDRNELVYHKKRNDKMQIALTFDDGPHPYYTPLILDILDEYGIDATFFTVGENIKYYPDAALRLISSRHEVENHTFSHSLLGNMAYSSIEKEIYGCEEAVFEVAEKKTKFLRPPGGQMSDVVCDVIRDNDYRVVLWDIDTRDWTHAAPEEICENVLSQIQSGDIILMHDFIGHNSPTPGALRLLIPKLLDRGYNFVTVSRLIEEN